MNNHPLAWTAPQPFWAGARGATAPHAVLSQPQILRFASDEFMNELLGTLEHDPASLAQYAVMEETWRGPGAGPEPRPSRWLERPPAKVLGLQRKSLLRARAAAVSAAQVSAPAPVAAPATVTAAPTRLKLYQPAHLRYYLVSGALVCQMPGLPDLAVDPARHKVSFVLRRLFTKTPVAAGQPLPDAGQTASWDEYAYVLRGKAGEWRRVAAADDDAACRQLVRAEERLSMFPAFYAQDDGHRRRLFMGSVPVGKREAYQGAAADPNPSDEDETAQARAQRMGTLDPRVVLFHTQVLGPWKALVNVAMGNVNVVPIGNELPGQDPDNVTHLKGARHERVFVQAGDKFNRNHADPVVLRAERSGLQIASWYLLLDLYLFLSGELPAFWREARKPSPAFAAPEAQALFVALRDAAFPAGLRTVGDNADLVETGSAYGPNDVKDRLIDALRAIALFEDALEAAPSRTATGTGSMPFEIPKASGNNNAPADMPAGWPTFLFLFADPWFGVRQPPKPIGFSPPPRDYMSEKIQARIDSLADLLATYLAVAPASDLGKDPLPEPTLASMQPADMREAWYVMRLVYERPECAPFHSTLMSAATRPFQMAGFFDSDAPARPIRIGLPLDISPAGLRKFDKNTMFMMSDMLCGQVDRFKGLGLVDLVLSVLPWPFHKGLSVPDKGPCESGVICSMSIPIITLCALILLTIIVSLLHAIFQWLPLFMVCFRLPGFKGKR